MIGIDEMMRLAVLQQRAFRCIEDELRRDGHHKSYEGDMEVSLSMPGIFRDDRTPSWTVSFSCYVLPFDGRHDSWEGRTLAEAVALAERDLGKICDTYEMARFSRQMDMNMDERGESDGSSTIHGELRPGANPFGCPPLENRANHSSDCAIHNAPVYEAGKCDCGKDGGR